MKVSVNLIRSYNNMYKSAADPMPGGINKLVEKVGAQLGAVDEVIDLGKKYQGTTVVKVVSCRKHPNADKLSLCLVDDNRVNKIVKRDKDGLIQVVCGAPNVKAGMLAAWIPPGATVPSTYDKDPFMLEAREIRGLTSNGMLASTKELALGDNHEGILEIDQDIKPGTDFAKAFNLDDYIIDIENKMFTHRPDLFGQLGIARELAGIQGYSYKSPDWYRIDAPVPSSKAHNDHKLKVKNEIPELVPRFSALVIKDIKVGPSPVWLQACLASLGVRAINNVVDLTNYLMLLTAQPLHAYDYNKVKTGILGVRLSKKDEKLKLLNGKEITLDNGAIVITDGAKPIGMGGVMGGTDTEVDESTKTIILECATFDMNTTRRTAMAYGLFTDAATRFTKNQSPLQNQAVIAKAASDILKIAGGRVCGKLVDENHVSKSALERGSINKPVNVSTEFINTRLGEKLTTAQAKKILENVEFKIEASGENLKVTTPFWRTDIEIPEDIVEEVGRLYGYDHLPLELPRRDLTPAPKNTLLEFKDRIRSTLAAAGVNEVLTYNFVHGNLLNSVGQDKALAYKISNALSPDLQYYRLSLTPSLLEKIHPNIKNGIKNFAIFEINKTHNKKHTQDGLPVEFEALALVFASSEKERAESGAAYYQVRKLLDYLGRELDVTFEYEPLDKKAAENFFVTKPFDHTRSAKVIAKNSKQPVGFIGEYRQEVAQKLKLPRLCAGFELDIELLQKVAKDQRPYTPLNKFPALEQDFTLRADAKLAYAQLAGFLETQLAKAAKEHGYTFEIYPLDIFQKPQDKSHKQTTWRIILAHPERTLTTEETNKLLAKMAEQAYQELKAERV